MQILLRILLEFMQTMFAAEEIIFVGIMKGVFRVTGDCHGTDRILELTFFCCGVATQLATILPNVISGWL